MDARDRSHGIVHAQPQRYGWSSQSPAKSSSNSIHHRRTASSSGYEDDGDDLASQSLPRYAAGSGEKPTARRSSPLARLVKSAAKQARRRPRLFISALIGLVFLLALLWQKQVGNNERSNKTVELQDFSSLADAKPFIDLNPRPITRSPSGTQDERYMAYFPHSVRIELNLYSTLQLKIAFVAQGYHNQRISLENALVLAKMLNRTLLIPPVWLGHAIPYIAFDKMYHRVMEANKNGLEHCKDIKGPNLIPHECLGGYWDYTILSWDFLVDLQRVAQTQPIIERWDMSYAWLEENLGLDLKQDMVKVKDSTLYQYRFYDSENDTTPLDKFQSRLDIPQLRNDYANVKLLHFGTLFGTTRVHLLDKENYAMRSLARSSMVFKNEHLDKVSSTIQDRLGGDKAYFGIHLRLGDGVFRDNAARNAEKLFDELCEKKLGLAKALVAQIKGDGRTAVEQRDATRDVEQMEEGAKTMSDQRTSSATEKYEKRSESMAGTKKTKIDPHLALPPLARISKIADSPLHSSLKCRKALYEEEDLLPLNTPIFLATDSSIPDQDPALKLFFDTFPCIFTLSDFSSSKPTTLNSEPIPAFEELNRLRNRDDGVPLAGFFYPLIDAMVAAKGRDMLGTPGVGHWLFFFMFVSSAYSSTHRALSVNLLWMFFTEFITIGR